MRDITTSLWVYRCMQIVIDINSQAKAFKSIYINYKIEEKKKKKFPQLPLYFDKGNIEV